MSRRHVITGEEILFAPQRASRQGAFVTAETTGEPCPFCPGHESDTPAEISRVGDSTQWLARVFPNKYPAVDGAEVIVESRDHDARFETIQHAADVVRLYVDRYRAHRDAGYTALFKNEGLEAGSSIPHLHSQLVPLPFVPPRIVRERDAFAGAAACPLCASLEFVIAETDAFRWIAPFASVMPYQQWIVPKRHVPAMADLDDSEIAELGELLRSVSRATSGVAPAFNWSFMNFARTAKAHAYIDVMPRLTAIAGLELGTGTFVEIIDPSAAAERLRP